MKALDAGTYDLIQLYCRLGDCACDTGDFVTAIERYRKAWNALPEPQSDWEASTWILTAIGDAYFANGDFVPAKVSLTNAMFCPGAVENAYVHLRLGQVYLELDDLDRSADEFARAYMLGGSEIFEGHDPKYFEFLKTKIVAPAGGNW